MVHYIDIFEKFADAVYSGEKTFEVRYNDRNYKVGDQIHFQAINSCKNNIRHPINFATYDIIYVLEEKDLPKEPRMLMPGYVLLGIKESTL